MVDLSPDRWRMVSPYLDEAMQLSGDEERAAWLARVRTRDATLADDLETLLDERGHASREGFLEGAAPAPSAPSPLGGQTVGPWTLVSLIGQGGMGNVWQARRNDGRFEGLAAVKLLNASLLGRAGEERFRREGSILARLADPHIARLLDAGVSPSGQPYLVLEYVEGEPIDRYCDHQGLGVNARIRLFLDVLEAVAHAHANLIVHRDIKPSNVMVDKSGQAKLLDFGIAKLLEGEGEAGAATALTREGGRALTPEFAAPEQITGGAVTTATDVYALGILLYVLLTGRHPAGAAVSSPVDLLRGILEAEPERPSTVVADARAQTAEEMRSHAAARETTPEALSRLLRGDLDTIVAKALKKEASERYTSVTALADDLRRYLRNEPIGARPDTWRYRVGKFVRRNRVGVAAAAVVAAAALAGAGGILWQAREAARQRDIARAQLDRATAANEFLGFLITDATPSGKKVSASDLFAQGERLVETQFADNPALRAEMLAMIGDRYLAAESWDKAIAALERSVRITQDPGVRARDLCSIAVARMASGQKDVARSIMKRALADLPNGPEYALPRAACLIRSSEFGFYDNQAEPMIASAREALRVLDTSPATSAVERIDAQNALAYGYFLKLDIDEADRAYAQLVASIEKAGRENTLAAAEAVTNWGMVHSNADIVTSEPLWRRALELHRFIDGPNEVAPTALFNCAFASYMLARYDDAERLFEEAIRNAHARGDDRIERGARLMLARLLTDRGELDRSAAELDKIRGDARDRGTFKYDRGLLSLATGDARSARDLLAESVELIYTASSGFEVDALIALSHAERSLGRTTAALAAANEALAAAVTYVPAGAPSYLIGHAEEALGEAQLAAGETGAARDSLCTAIEQLDRALGPNHPVSLRARKLLETAAPAP